MSYPIDWQVWLCVYIDILWKQLLSRKNEKIQEHEKIKSKKNSPQKKPNQRKELQLGKLLPIE